MKIFLLETVSITGLPQLEKGMTCLVEHRVAELLISRGVAEEVKEETKKVSKK